MIWNTRCLKHNSQVDFSFLLIPLFIALFMIGNEQSARSQEKVYAPVNIGQHVDRNGISEEILPRAEEVFYMDKDQRGKISDEQYRHLLDQRDKWLRVQRENYLERFVSDPYFEADTDTPIETVVEEFSKDSVRISIVFAIGHSRWHHYYILLKDYLTGRNEMVDQIFRLRRLEEVYGATFQGISYGTTYADMVKTLGIDYKENIGQSLQFRELWYPAYDLEVVMQDDIVKYVQHLKPAWVDEQERSSHEGIEEQDTNLVISFDGFDVRYIDGLGFSAFDRDGRFLFEVNPYDNGPDYPSDGLIRIREKGKIGYADLDGHIVIPPSFNCAFPFEDGLARICSGGTLEQEGEYEAWKGAMWGAIDREGNIVIEPFDLGMFTFDILNLKESLIRDFAGLVEVGTRWGKLDSLDLFLGGEGEGLFVDLQKKDQGKLLLTYLFLPYQDLTFRPVPEPDAVIPTEQLVTVTPAMIVYLVDMAPSLTEGEMDTVNDLANLMEDQMGWEETKALIREEEGFSTARGLQIMAFKEFPYYIEVSVAIPGSSNLSPDTIRKEFPRKMILLHLVPDIGSIHSQWIKPGPPEDDDLQEYFFVTETDAEPGTMIREEPPPADAPPRTLLDGSDLFPDYVPKRTPDTMLDYMPSLLSDLATIAEPNLSNLSNLINLYNQYKDSASSHPGEWVDGNIILGAREREYRPSADELVLMEIGERIGAVVSETDPVELKQVLKQVHPKPGKIEFTRFFFIHYDVMGSGRFFYIDGMEEVSFIL